jgi:nucleotide-binding universal stress UspA family protein
MAKTILVPLDGSTFAEHALPIALGLARASGARLHLVQVHELRLVPMAPEAVVPYAQWWDAALREQEREYLRSASNRVMERGGIVVRAELLDGAPEIALATYAREMEVDLIVMTTHGRGGLSRMWLGSVADAVIRRSHVPVLVLRPSHAEVDFRAELLPRHILIPLDGSELSTGIIDPATWLGSFSRARYTLLRVVLPMPLVRAPSMYPETWADRELLEEERSRAVAEIEAAAARLRDRGFTVETAVVHHANPAVAIMDHAATNAVDMIAIATHGRGGWSRFALGSVADKVLRGSLMPVLIYRPPVRADEGAVETSRAEATAAL